MTAASDTGGLPWSDVAAVPSLPTQLPPAEPDNPLSLSRDAADLDDAADEGEDWVGDVELCRDPAVGAAGDAMGKCRKGAAGGGNGLEDEPAPEWRGR